MEQNIKQKVKLIMVDETPYIVNSEVPQIGDEVVVTVGGQYPSLVKIENQIVYDLILNKNHTLTQAFKIFMRPEYIKFTPEQIEKILENNGLMDVEYDGTKYNYTL
jgi:hypothetical protein